MPHDSGDVPNMPGLTDLTWQEWLARWWLRTLQALLAAALYLFYTWMFVPQETARVCIPLFHWCTNRAHVVHLLVGMALVVPFFITYSFLARNKAGSYYSSDVKILISFPAYFRRVKSRACSRDGIEVYLQCIAEEHRARIFRTVNCLDSAFIYLFVFVSAELLDIVYNHHVASAAMNSDLLHIRSLQALIVFGIHRVYAMNWFQLTCKGFIQPEAMWMFIANPLTQEDFIGTCGCIQPGGTTRMFPCHSPPSMLY
jgi:hypothetical protein